MPPRLRTALAAGGLVFIAMSWSTPSAASDDGCAALRDEMAAALAEDSVIRLRIVADRATAEPSCDAAFRSLIRAHVAQAVERRVRNGLAEGRPLEVFEADLLLWLSYAEQWQPLAWLGDIARERDRFSEAANYYQRALAVIQDATATPQAPPAEVIGRIFHRGEQARLLADDHIPASAAPLPQPAPAATPVPPGPASPVPAVPVPAVPVPAVPVPAVPVPAVPVPVMAPKDIRGFIPERVALPIEFKFDSVQFTAKGLAAVGDLLESLHAQNSPDITLIGHTDPQGDAGYNLKLSIRRAEAVRDFLIRHGYTGAIRAEGRGEAEPLAMEDPSRYSTGQLYQLYRRVELHR